MEQAERILGRIDSEALIKLAVDLGNIPSPKGREREVGDYIHSWLLEGGVAAFKQEVLPNRNNVVGVLKGTGGGRSLIFNSHMDTIYWEPEDVWVVKKEQLFYNHAWMADGKVFGMGVVNDKGPMACFLIAAKAIKDSGVELRGDLILTAVAGEIGGAPIDEFQGPQYMGKGLGARFMVEHGVWGDSALVAETTGFGLTWAEAGCAFFKITVAGKNTYTPYILRPVDWAENPNAIVKMAKVVEAIEDWALDYERRNEYQFSGGLMVPKVNVGAIRGGLPFRPTVTSAVCSIYVDVRIPPDGNPASVQRELEELMRNLGIDGKIEMYMFRKGYQGKGIEPLRSALEEAHEYIFKKKPGGVPPPVCSMWRDINVFNGVGIPAITYGPGGGRAEGEEGTPYLSVDDLLKASQVYALTALKFCE